jgi:hypothetical protein
MCFNNRYNGCVIGLNKRFVSSYNGCYKNKKPGNVYYQAL